MANRESDGRRYRHNLQGLLQMAADNSDDPQADTSSVFQEMSEEVSLHCKQQYGDVYCWRILFVLFKYARNWTNRMDKCMQSKSRRE